MAYICEMRDEFEATIVRQVGLRREIPGHRTRSLDNRLRLT